MKQNTIIRDSYQSLLDWANSKNRKVLLIKGARQVGKTFLVRELGKSFHNFIELNLIEKPEARAFFKRGDLGADNILSSISAYVGQRITDGDTLLFIDEIQACPEAIEALRFFYEQRPNLHVIATGSLVEFALENITSFGVGRVEYLHLYPLSFYEFLGALKEDLLLEQIKTATPASPLIEPLHAKALGLLKTYLTIGGLPEAVVRYVESKSILEVFRLLLTLLKNYEDDFSKYRGRVAHAVLAETLRSTALQGGKKFIFSHAFRDANSKTVHSALEMLCKAGLVLKVYHCSGNAVPLANEADMGKFKTLPVDVGIFNALVGQNLSELQVLDPGALVNKGTLCEVFVGLELLKLHPNCLPAELHYWHREERSSSAEVDYLISSDRSIVPVEVKASTQGGMKSLHMFLKDKKASTGLRISSENFSRYENIVVCPMYAVPEVWRVLEG